jgi:hypothetical protein
MRALADYETEIVRFKPSAGLAATNSNDVREFVFDWFRHFEHAAAPDYYVAHLSATDLKLAFPGGEPLTSPSAFVAWYNNLLAQTVWNFHDVSQLQVKRVSATEFAVSFIVDWYCEVRADSEQLAGWQVRSDSNLYHHTLRQTWTVKAADQLRIESLVVSAGDTPSPIAA